MSLDYIPLMLGVKRENYPGPILDLRPPAPEAGALLDCVTFLKVTTSEREIGEVFSKLKT